MRRLHVPVLLISAGAGLIGGIVNYFLYILLADILSLPLLIGLLFLAFAIVMGVALLIMGIVTDQSDETFFFLDSRGKLIAALAVVVVLVFGFGMLLQWLYQIEPKVETETKIEQPAATSYIFLLDESGSMAGNDPTEERYNAVNAVMQADKADTPFAVYMFANECRQVRPMAPLKDGKFQASSAVGADLGTLTHIYDGLETILNDMNTGKLQNTGAAPRVILLSDGNPSDDDMGVIDKYKTAGISISTVALGPGANGDLLNSIAKDTGGVGVKSDRAEDLAQGFSSAVSVVDVSVEDTSRDLLGKRNTVNIPILYALLRVLFLTLLGAVIAVAKSVAWGEESNNWRVILAGIVTSLVGAILAEVLLLFGIPLWIPQILFWILVAITPVQRPLPPPPMGMDQILF